MGHCDGNNNFWCNANHKISLKIMSQWQLCFKNADRRINLRFCLPKNLWLWLKRIQELPLSWWSHVAAELRCIFEEGLEESLTRASHLHVKSDIKNFKTAFHFIFSHKEKVNDKTELRTDERSKVMLKMFKLWQSLKVTHCRSPEKWTWSIN